MIFKPTELYPDNLTYSADEEIKITWKNNGDIMYSFEIIVENNETGQLAFHSGKIESYDAEFTIPANTFVNGNVYRYKIQVYNKVNNLAISDYKIFKCYTRPNVYLLNDGVIRNQIATVMGEYSQAEGLPLKAYKFILYDEYYNLLEQSDYIYDGLLQYTFNYKLVDDTKYKIELVCITQNDLLGTSGKVDVLADYTPPSVHFNLGVESFYNKPYVRLTWTTVRIIGNSDITPIYIDNEKIDLRNNKIYFDDGFNLESNFTIRFWFESIEEDLEVLKLIGENGEIAIKYYNNKFHAFKTIAGYTVHVATKELNISNNTSFFLSLQQIGNNLNIFSEVV